MPEPHGAPGGAGHPASFTDGPITRTLVTFSLPILASSIPGKAAS